MGGKPLQTGASMCVIIGRSGEERREGRLLIKEYMKEIFKDDQNKRDLIHIIAVKRERRKKEWSLDHTTHTIDL
jgi:hypothetical protein